MEKKKVIRKKKIQKKHIVVFQDEQNNVQKTVFVNDGDSVQPPEVKMELAEKKHYKVKFAGWDQDISCVHSNLVVCPVYEDVPKEYLIMYFHENGKILGTETVSYGKDARADFHPSKKETEEYRYHFAGWSCDLHSIDSDRMAKAIFHPEKKTYPVRFFDAYGGLLMEQQIIYGEPADMPPDAEKEQDLTYRYLFKGWDRKFDRVVHDLDIYPVFEPQYIDYLISFYENGQLLREDVCHYNDEIHYPELRKKGFDYIWNDHPDRVHRSQHLDGRWQYSNPKGRRIQTDSGIYEIVNPSIANGSVRCLSYVSDEERVILPDKVRLGDYFYNIEYIHKEAFINCPNMKKLICKGNVKYIDEKAFASNKKLTDITLGKHIRSIGANAFAKCAHLRKITIQSENKIRLGRDCFQQMNNRVQIMVPSSGRIQYNDILRKTKSEKNVELVIMSSL